MYDLAGQVALVTGAASGIGRAVALRLAREGCDIAILDVSRERASEASAGVEAMGRRCIVQEVDIASPTDVEDAVATIAAQLGPIDIAVNCAGVLCVASVQEMSASDWARTFAVNAGGVFNCCKAVLPSMIDRRRGCIVNTASWFGKVGKPFFAAYCASKFAVIGFTQSLAMEVAGHGIRVNAVCPGTIGETNMRIDADRAAVRLGLPTAKEREHTIPLGRAGRPDDVARVVAFLASGESGYMTGQSVNVTGGLWLS